MKRAFAGILAVLLLCGLLIGCEKPQEVAEPTPEPTETTVPVVELTMKTTLAPIDTPEPTPEPEPTPIPTPTSTPTEEPTPSPTPEPTPTPDSPLKFSQDFVLCSTNGSGRIILVTDNPKSIEKGTKVELRLADGTVVGSGKLKQQKENSISFKLPENSSVRTSLYLYMEGVNYPIDVHDVAMMVTGYQPIYGNYERDDLMVAFTFDCAFGEENTDWLLDTLAKYNIHATFFMTGQWMSNHGKWIERMIREGHELGNHSLTHPNMKGMEADKVYKEINTPYELLLQNHGYRTHLFRAPYGYNSGRSNTVAQFLGCEAIKWGQTSGDSDETKSAKSIITLLLKETETQPGDIILCHNDAKQLRSYLIPVIEEFIKRGYTFGTVSELMGWTWDDTYTEREARMAAGETFDFD